MNTYDFALETKTLGDAGEFEGYASTFGNVDQGGDVVEPGAFIEGLVKAKSEGRNIPMLWQHKQDEPIGVWTDVAEDTKGLYVKGRLLIDADPLAKRAYGLLKEKALGGMSIGYRIPAGGMQEDEKRRGVYRLKKIDLREISLVTMPMNIAAKVTRVKAEAEAAVTKLAAGDRLTEREWERVLKHCLDLSNAEAERAVRVNLKHGQGEPGDAPDEASDFLAALLR